MKIFKALFTFTALYIITAVSLSIINGMSNTKYGILESYWKKDGKEYDIQTNILSKIEYYPDEEELYLDQDLVNNPLIYTSKQECSFQKYRAECHYSSGSTWTYTKKGELYSATRGDDGQSFHHFFKPHDLMTILIFPLILLAQD